MSKNKKWTEQLLLEDAKKYRTRKEWQVRSASAYVTALKKGLVDKACSHMIAVQTRWTNQKIMEDAKKYSTIVEWRRQSSAYKAARRQGILSKCCAHMKKLRKKWTSSAIHQDAKKYSSRREWQKKSPSAYSAYLDLRKKMDLRQVCAHMTPKPTLWTNQKIMEDAKKYRTRKEWEDGSSAYQAATKRGILDLACKHMKRTGGTSKPEQDILALVKHHYPKAHTLRDRKVSIPNKPHIQGFHIDIYIPELRKGIEFNGEYWHSIEGLKRSRKDWPQEDLENYHLLKTEHFRQKNIEILTIEEKEWIENPNRCIGRIVNFLKQGNISRE